MQQFDNATMPKESSMFYWSLIMTDKMAVLASYVVLKYRIMYGKLTNRRNKFIAGVYQI